MITSSENSLWCSRAGAGAGAAAAAAAPVATEAPAMVTAAAPAAVATPMVIAENLAQATVAGTFRYKKNRSLK